jgi:serine/threonine protein kinase
MRFERYEILSQLGAGGMGEVYRARDTQLARTVALKVLRAGLDSKRLLREAQATAALQHPHAVAIYDVGEEQGTPFLVMEFLQGQTLGAYLGDSSVSVRQKVTWLMQVGAALAAAHELSVVHRDIKPDNIFITTEGVAKVLDFGLARGFHGEAPEGERRMLGTLTAHQPQSLGPGTPLYMAPEQFKGEPADGRTDQFALGLVGYELLSGGLPWQADGNLPYLLAQVLMTPPPPLAGRVPGLPPTLQAAILRALAKDPAERFAHMTAFVEALGRSLIEDDPLAQTQLPPPEASPRLAAAAKPPSSLTSSRAASPLVAASFLEFLARSLRAAGMPEEPDEDEVEAFIAHRVFDIADSARLHCAARECKRPGRVGLLASRPGKSRHELKKALFSFSLFKEWGEYSLPVCIAEHVDGASEDDFLGELWELLAAFAPLRVALSCVEDEDAVAALFALVLEESAASGWHYPPGTADLVLLRIEGAPGLDWRVLHRPAGSGLWIDAGSVLAPSR